MRVCDFHLHKQCGREVRNFDIAAWERERENIKLVGSYAKFAQTPVVQPHLLDTGDRLLAETSPYDVILGIGYRADGISARHPSLWCGLSWLGKILQTVAIYLPRSRTATEAPPTCVFSGRLALQ